MTPRPNGHASGEIAILAAPRDSETRWPVAVLVTLALAAASALAVGAVAKFQAGEAYAAAQEMKPEVATLKELVPRVEHQLEMLNQKVDGLKKQ